MATRGSSSSIARSPVAAQAAKLAPLVDAFKADQLKKDLPQVRAALGGLVRCVGSRAATAASAASFPGGNACSRLGLAHPAGRREQQPLVGGQLSPSQQAANADAAAAASGRTAAAAAPTPQRLQLSFSVPISWLFA